MTKVQIKKLHPDARIPEYAHASDAGLDLYTVAPVTIAPGERVQVPTGLVVVVPDGFVGLVWDKSGLSHKHGLKMLGGVLDAGYRGELMVGIVNLSDEIYVLEAGHKVAQLLVQKVEHAEIEVVESVDTTERGKGAFGSSGK